MPVLPRLIASSVLFVALAPAALPAPQHAADKVPGLFQGSIDIGQAQPGSTRYDPERARYEIRGGGDDVWGTADSFRFAWTQLSGDASLAADLHIDAPVTFRLAKGMLMFRQSLDPGSPYADVALHADGHVTLQYRLRQGGETRDITLPVHNVAHLRIIRQGDTFTAYTEPRGASAPPAVTVPMHGLVYVGIGVCSHNSDALQTVTFSHIMLAGAAH